MPGLKEILVVGFFYSKCLKQQKTDFLLSPLKTIVPALVNIRGCGLYKRLQGVL